MRGRMGTGTDLAGWGGDGDDFHPHAHLYPIYSGSPVGKRLSTHAHFFILAHATWPINTVYSMMPLTTTIAYVQASVN